MSKRLRIGLDHNSGHPTEDQTIYGDERDDPDFDSDLDEDAKELKPSNQNDDRGSREDMGYGMATPR